jgi:L-methionine (R)-S-oxide reductase
MHTIEKSSDYSLLLKQVSALIETESDELANMANISSFVYHQISNLNWVGFYILRDKQLVLGPFNGLPACTRIDLNHGVCGTAAVLKQTLNVPDVHQFKGHIACDSASLSECVIPYMIHDEVIAVYDVDSPLLNRFDLELQQFLEDVIQLLKQKRT